MKVKVLWVSADSSRRKAVVTGCFLRYNEKQKNRRAAKGEFLMDKWDLRFMEMADLVSTWASCWKPDRHIGAVIVKNKRVMTTGYNGAPSGVKPCRDRNECRRYKMGIPSGQRQELCYAVHAEQNAIIQAARLGISIDGATLYCTHQPCVTCAKMIVNAGIVRVVYREGYPDAFAMEIFDEAGVTVERMQPQDTQ